ncbi:hypothetical protein RS030_71120 [Cryptosporidium xiaoi]|uniref:Uncharacterized protein n=1 Tax=Cryptosporidium xiaoi TaxID=659607 RepID=A0AAV9XTZ8_9CRYT
MDEFHRIPIIIRYDMSDDDESGDIGNGGKRVGLLGGLLSMAERVANKSGVDLKGEIIEKGIRKGKEVENGYVMDYEGCDPFDLVERLKEQGCKYYEKKHYDLALKEYLKAKSVLEIEMKMLNSEKCVLGSFNVEKQVDYLLSMFVLESNCIACYIGKKDYNRSIVESKRVLSDMSLKEQYFNKMNIKLSTLWRNIENKILYRRSMSLFSLYGNDRHRRNENIESFELVSRVYYYYNKELMVEPPKEILILYLNLKDIVESYNSEEKTTYDNHEETYKELPEDEKQSDYLRLYIEAYYNGNYQEIGCNNTDFKITKLPVEIISKLPYNTNVDFIRIWQNISHNDQWIDYYIIYRKTGTEYGSEIDDHTKMNVKGCVFEKVDKLFEKTELDPVILEKIIERISAILEKVVEIPIETDLEKQKDNKIIVRQAMFLDNILGLVKKLTKIHKFDFTLMMMPKGSDFNILGKLAICSKRLPSGVEKTNLESDIKSFVDSLMNINVVF